VSTAELRRLPPWAPAERRADGRGFAGLAIAGGKSRHQDPGLRQQHFSLKRQESEDVMSDIGLHIEAQRTAIIAVDFQSDIMGADGAFAAMFHAEVARTKLIPRTARLLEAARRAGVKVAYSRAAFHAGLRRPRRQSAAVQPHRRDGLPRRGHGRDRGTG